VIRAAIATAIKAVTGTVIRDSVVTKDSGVTAEIAGTVVREPIAPIVVIVIRVATATATNALHIKVSREAAAIKAAATTSARWVKVVPVAIKAAA